MVLFVFYINMRSIDWNNFNQNFWKAISCFVVVVNLMMVFYSFGLTSIGQDGAFNLSYQSLNESHLIFHVNGNYITSMLNLWIPINIYLITEKKSFRKSLTLLLGLSIFIVLIYNSRASTGALMVMLILAGVYYFKKYNSAKSLLISSGVFILFFAFVLLFISNSESYIEQYNPLRTILDETGDDRFEMWRHSAELIRENPIIGTGSGSWFIEVGRYGVNDFNNYKSYQHAHNIFIETFSELGVIGFLPLFILFTFPFLLFFANSQENRPIHFYISLSILGFIFVNCFYGIVAIWLHLLCIWVVFVSWLLSNRLFQKYGNSLLLFPLLLLAISFMGFKEFADMRVRQFKRIAKTNLQLGKRYLNQAHRPGIYDFYKVKNMYFLKEPLVSGNDPEVAIKMLETGLHQSPYDAQAWYRIGQQYGKLNEYDAALKAYKYAIELNNKHFPSYLAIAKIGNRKKYWKEYEFGASIFEESLIPHKKENFDPHTIKDKNEVVQNYWFQRNEYIRKFLKIKEKRQELIDQAN